MRNKEATIQQLKKLAANTNTNEKLAALQAVERLQKSLEKTKQEYQSPEFLSIGLAIEGPLFESYKASPWRTRLLVALCLQFCCIPFATENQVIQSTRTDSLSKRYVFGMTREARIVHTTFKSLQEQINLEARKFCSRVPRSSFESFREGLVSALATDLANGSDPFDPRWTVLYSAAKQKVKEFVQQQEEGTQYAWLKHVPNVVPFDTGLAEIGKQRADRLSVSPLLSKPKP